MRVTTLFLAGAAAAAFTSGLATPALAAVSDGGDLGTSHHQMWLRPHTGYAGLPGGLSALRHGGGDNGDDDNGDDDGDGGDDGDD